MERGPTLYGTPPSFILHPSMLSLPLYYTSPRSPRFMSCDQNSAILHGMTTFHPFPRLPAELRAQIWELTVEPRVVDVRVRMEHCIWRGKVTRVVRSSTPVPGPLQTCREARNSRLYQREFSDLDYIVTVARKNRRPRPGPEPERRYVWLNLDIDMVSIGSTAIKCYDSVDHSIKRLRLERDSSEEYWSQIECDLIHNFANATEIHVIIPKTQDFMSWHGASRECWWPCAFENVFFIDTCEDQMLNLADLEEMCDQQFEVVYRKQNPDEQGPFYHGYPCDCTIRGGECDLVHSAPLL